MKKLFRVRFHANPWDYRSVIWPVKYPYWCSGYGDDYSIVVAYVDSKATLLKQWPEATEIEMIPTDKVEFSDRFTRPDWFKEQEDK